jgi:hypothetical protein
MNTSRDSKLVAHVLAEVAFKPHNAGGRPMMPVGSGYAPYLRSEVTAEDLAVRVNNVPAGADFGQTISVSIELSYYPQQDYGPLVDGVPIQLIEGPKVVAEGVCKSAIITV